MHDRSMKQPRGGPRKGPACKPWYRKYLDHGLQVCGEPHLFTPRVVHTFSTQAAQLREEMTLLTGESRSPKRAMRPTLRVAAGPGVRC